ncbi:tRNA-dihydrouridine synthase [Globomyces pollinis-pini]|nr:tRNA-dihydrouridine synthase [Globomyces pollinis-pini]
MEIIERKHPKTLLDDKKTLNICAPMVRYSKLAFRELVRIYNVDLVYTPMILSDVFKHSSLSREAEFKTNYNDDPVIVQFAASNGKDAADAAELVAKYVNGVDINCGCPQKWAIGEGIGSYLMTAPETVKDIVDQVKRRTAPIKMSNGQSFPCSIKIRIHDDVKETVELVRRAEKVGVDWITVHGRTKKQRNTEDVNMDYIKIVKEHSSVPVFANGGVTTKNEAEHLVDYTKTDGVMVAQGLLNNPGNLTVKFTSSTICWL